MDTSSGTQSLNEISALSTNFPDLMIDSMVDPLLSSASPAKHRSLTGEKKIKYTEDYIISSRDWIYVETDEWINHNWAIESYTNEIRFALDNGSLPLGVSQLTVLFKRKKSKKQKTGDNRHTLIDNSPENLFLIIHKIVQVTRNWNLFFFFLVKLLSFWTLRPLGKEHVKANRSSTQQPLLVRIPVRIGSISTRFKFQVNRQYAYRIIALLR